MSQGQTFLIFWGEGAILFRKNLTLKNDKYFLALKDKNIHILGLNIDMFWLFRRRKTNLVHPLLLFFTLTERGCSFIGYTCFKVCDVLCILKNVTLMCTLITGENKGQDMGTQYDGDRTKKTGCSIGTDMVTEMQLKEKHDKVRLIAFSSGMSLFFLLKTITSEKETVSAIRLFP